MPTWPTSRSPRRIASPVAHRGLEAQPAQVAVGLALVVEAGDRLLADVAALGEADGALVDAGLLGDRGRRHLAPEARAAGLHPEDLGRRLGDARHGFRASAAGVAALRSDARGRSGRRRGRLRRRGISTPPTRVLALGVLGRRAARAPDASLAAGPITDRSAQSPDASSISTSRPTLYIRRWRIDRSGRLGLGVEPDVAGREAQDPHVGLHVALAVEQRGVAAGLGLERLDVVGELALEELGRVGPAHQEHRSGRALQHAGALAQRAVLPVELDRELGAHLTDCRERGIPPANRFSLD